MRRVIGLGCGILCAAACLPAAADTPPAATIPAFTPRGAAARTMELHFKNVPLDSVLSSISDTLGFIVIKSMALPERVTLDVDHPVDAAEAVVLLQRQLETLGCDIRPTVVGSTDTVPGRLILRIGTAAEVRAADEEAALPALPAITERSGVSSEAMTIDFRNRDVNTAIAEVAQKFGYSLIAPGSIKGMITVRAREPVHAEEAVKLLADVLFPIGYTAWEKVVTNPDGTRVTELHVQPIGEWRADTLAARRALTRPAKP